MTRHKIAGLAILLQLMLAAALFASGNSELVNAAREGDIEAVRALVNAGIDINEAEEYSGVTALMGATGAGHEEIVRLLIGAGADVNARSSGFMSEGNTALMSAADAGHEEIVRVRGRERSRQGRQHGADRGL